MDKSYNPSIVTVVAIALDQPQSFTSICFIGATETVYMSVDSLYLATTSSEYTRLGFLDIVDEP